MPEQIELATILLTDLVGSTRLATAVGPVRADQLRDEHFGVLREAIVSCAGKEVKNTGDGLMVAFGSTSAAVRCAVLMQQLFEQRHRRTEQQLHIRIGLGAGESTVQDGDYFGMPSIEAARLCDRAPTDGILVSSLVKALAGRVGGVLFESVGELELKGFNEPVEAFTVSWSPLGEGSERPSTWPLPALLRSVPPAAYVGRKRERAVIEGARTRARDGVRQVVLLSGEPGIGKSRLAAYAAHAAHGEGFGVLWGACSEELAVPYEPWIEVSSQLVEHAPPDLLERYVARHGGELLRLARNLAARVPHVPEPQSSDPETERFLLFSAVAGALVELPASIPVCLVLDDFHWADGQSVALLKHVARAAESSALQLIVAYRDSDLGKDHPLSSVLADLRQVGGVERIALHGLGTDEVAQVLTGAAGHELDADGLALAAEIAAETDGNPFFVGEVLRSLLEAGRLLYDEATGRWSVDRSSPLGLPESVRDVLGRRVERLGEEARELLTLAAVIGRSFELELLTGLVEMDETRLLDHLEAAVAASLLDESTEQVGQFRFVHQLINQTLYAALGATRRARLHHRVAVALEELYGSDPGEHVGELALHWRLATMAVDRRKAAEYSCLAGQRALDSLAPTEAAKLYTDAVELLGSTEDAERCRALIGLGEAQRLIGDAAYRETLLEASRIASALEAGDLAARAAVANSRGLPSMIGTTDVELLGTIERALELDDQTDPGRRGRLLGIQSLELSYDPGSLARRRALADEAISIARGAADPGTLAGVLRDVFHANWSADRLQQLQEIVDEMIGAATQAGDPALQWWSSRADFTVSLQAGRFERAAAALARQRRLADELGQPALLWLACSYEAGWELLRGHLAEAEELAKRSRQIGQDADPFNSGLYYAAQVGYIRMIQGRSNIAALEQSVAAYPGIPAWRAALARTYCSIGAFEQAAAIVRDAARDRFEHVHWDPIRLLALASYASAAAESRCVEAAEILYVLLEPWADQLALTDIWGYGHTRAYLGLLAETTGRNELADEHFEFACRFHDDNDLLLWAAESHVAYARALFQRGDAVGAQEHAQRALELSQANGYRLFETQAAAILEGSKGAVGV